MKKNVVASLLLIVVIAAITPTAFGALMNNSDCNCQSNQVNTFNQMQVSQMGQTGFSNELSQIFATFESKDDPNNGAFLKLLNSGLLNSNSQTTLTQNQASAQMMMGGNMQTQMMGGNYQSQMMMGNNMQSQMMMGNNMQSQMMMGSSMPSQLMSGSYNTSQMGLGMTSSPTLFSGAPSGYNQNQMYSYQMYPQQMMGQTGMVGMPYGYVGQQNTMSGLGMGSGQMSSGLTGGLSFGFNLGLNAGVSTGFY